MGQVSGQPTGQAFGQPQGSWLQPQINSALTAGRGPNISQLVGAVAQRFQPQQAPQVQQQPAGLVQANPPTTGAPNAPGAGSWPGWLQSFATQWGTPGSQEGLGNRNGYIK